MEQSFWGKLKRVKLGDLLHIFKFIIAFLIALVYKRNRKDMWLLCDTENEARDNAYWLFKYIRNEHKNIDAVYAINKKSPDYNRVKDLGEVVDYGSLKHWVYYLTAHLNISSQKMGKPNAAICYVLEVYGIIKNKRIFLQHGIITADLSFLYYKNTKMCMFMTSTQAEYDYVNDNYGYPKGYVKKTGLCRFDGLHDAKVNKKQILIMPTWRMYIRNEIKADNESQEKSKFLETDYYKYWSKLLGSDDFMEYVEDNDFNIIFYPHREMYRFLKYFNVDNPRITVASWPEYDVQKLLKESALLITDFSSVAMDFAYMKKPLIYYQFDDDKFRAGHHGRGYFDFKKDGFGPVCENPEEVIGNVIHFGNNNFRNDNLYDERHEGYFDLWDDRNCERTFEVIMEGNYAGD